MDKYVCANCGAEYDDPDLVSNWCAGCILQQHLKDHEPLHRDEVDFIISAEIASDHDFVAVGGGLWAFDKSLY